MRLTLTQAEAEALVRAGAAALHRGDARGARAPLERAVAAGAVNPQILLMLAYACRSTGDVAAEEAAIDRLLKHQPGNFQGLVMKGDCRVASGDSGAATSFYRSAQAVADEVGQLPPELAADMARVEAWLQRADSRYRDHLETFLTSAGIGAGERTRRFQQSLEIMSGAKQVYMQQPGLYYFPELPQRQFYERGEFPWLEDVEGATEAIRDELLAVMEEAEESFRPYLVSSAGRPRTDYHGLADNPDWSSFYLWEKGGPVEKNAARCPRTFEAISRVPLPYVTTRAPVVMFSWLKAGARIPPHTGSINTRLICHLPLIVPESCGFRVGNETRRWEVGKTLIFDDTIEHEAWNDSGKDRVLLIFDIWRPELSAEERRAVIAMFEAVDAFTG